MPSQHLKVACTGGCGRKIRKNHSGLCADCYRQQRDAIKPGVRSVTTDALHRRANDAQTPEDRPSEDPTADHDATRDVQVERLRADARLYERAYRQTVKTRAEEERLIDLFTASIAKFPPAPPHVFTPRPPAREASSAAEVPVLLLGDQQIGEVIRLEETFGINRYDFGVYQARLEALEDRVTDILTNHQRAPFEELVVLSLGDNISGVIHEELQKYGHQHIVDQVYLGALTSALFIYRLLVRLRPRGIKRVRVSCVSGNHGRLSEKKESKQYYKNFDYLFHSIMARALADVPEIEMHIPRCLFTVVEVAQHRVLQSHGHEMPPSSLGIPLYSINRGSASYQELLSWTDASRFDYWVMGHFHRPLELDNSIVNGTMAGISEFGIGRFKPIRPMQRLLGFHPKWGLAWEYKLRLDKAPERPSIYTFDPDMGTIEANAIFDDRRRTAGAAA